MQSNYMKAMEQKARKTKMIYDQMVPAVPVQREDHDFHGQIPCMVWEAPHTTQRNPIVAAYHRHRRHRRNG